MSDVVIIGAGAAGLMAAGAAVQAGAAVTVLERNRAPARKLLLTGKGRCNVTNNASVPNIIKAVVSNPRFLYGAISALDAAAVMSFFEERGVPLVTERGGRVFPASGKSADVAKALRTWAGGAKIVTNARVQGIRTVSGGFSVQMPGGSITARACIIATGGKSYPATGSVGDGLRFARALGHTTTPTRPGLVPLLVSEDFTHALAGLTLKNVRLHVFGARGAVFCEQGDLLFAPGCITGPLVLSASSHLDGLPARVHIDLKPALDMDTLDARLLRDFRDAQNKALKNSLQNLLPMRLIDVVISQSGADPLMRINELPRSARRALAQTIKALRLTVTDTAGYPEAVITQGGVNVREVHPSTMMSKIHPGLFFAGEVLDVDARCGGYNLQIAFACGYAAGLGACAWLAGG